MANNQDFQNNYGKNQQEQRYGAIAAAAIIYGIIWLLGKSSGGNEVIGMIAVLAIIGTIIGYALYCSNASERNNIPKIYRGSFYRKERSKKELEIGCKYGFPNKNDTNYEAYKRELRALDDEYCK